MLKKRPPQKRIKPSDLICRDINEIYREIEQVGSGTYGRVFKAYIREDPKKIVALKKIETEKEVQGYPITALREISHLKKLDHPNIVKLYEIVTSKPIPPSKRGSTFLVFEYVEHDLMGLIARKIRFNLNQIKCALKQLLEGLQYLQCKKILHRDLKTANILYSNKGEIKIADFGLSRHKRPGTKPLTVRVVTLLYRAPEILLGMKDYSEKADMWSLGCIFAELLIGEPLFLTARNPNSLMDLIIQKFGTPSEDYWPEMKNLPYFNDIFPNKEYKPQLRNYLRKKKARIDKLGVDLLEKMLELHPDKRISCNEALRHPFFHAEPRACDLEDMPKIEKDCHEFNIRQEIAKRKNKMMTQRMNLPGNIGSENGESNFIPTQNQFNNSKFKGFKPGGKSKKFFGNSNWSKYAPPGFRNNNINNFMNNG